MKGCECVWRLFYMMILGANELGRGVIQIKDMKKGEQKEIPIDSVLSYFQNLIF